MLSSFCVRGLWRSCKFTCKAAHELAGIVFIMTFMCVTVTSLVLFPQFPLEPTWFERQLLLKSNTFHKLDTSCLLHSLTLWHAHHLHYFLYTHLLRNLKNVHTFKPTFFTLTLHRICPSLRVFVCILTYIKATVWVSSIPYMCLFFWRQTFFFATLTFILLFPGKKKEWCCGQTWTKEPLTLSFYINSVHNVHLNSSLFITLLRNVLA